MRFKAFSFTIIISCLLICVGLNSAMAQNFNIDFGTDCGTPAITYGAAGQVGLWNAISSTGVSPLTDIAGVATSATVNVIAPLSFGNSCADCSPPVNTLVGDFFYTSIGTWSVVFNNLTDGDYTALIYAPSQSLIPTGIMDVNGVSVPTIWGNNCNLLQGTSYVAIPVTVTGGTLTISGASSAAASGLAGIQLQTPIVTASIPTLTEWGMILFLLLAGLGAVYYMRSQKKANN